MLLKYVCAINAGFWYIVCHWVTFPAFITSINFFSFSFLFLPYYYYIFFCIIATSLLIAKVCILFLFL